MDELVSVIVPVYKVEPYLRECIDSILANTYQNLEIILVDDGSPDNCGAICDEYAEKDSRVHVIHQENKGIVGARNAGLDIAKGTYVSFVDSDDIVSPILYETLVNIINKTHADMVGCGECREIGQLECKKLENFNIYHADTYEKKLAVITTAPSVRSLTWTNCYVWNKLYRKDLIHTPFCPECLLCEDLRFNWNYIKGCNLLVTIPIPLYYYRPNENSITFNYKSFSCDPEFGIANAQTWKLLAEDRISDNDLSLFLKARAVYTAHSALLRIYTQKESKREQYRDIIAHLALTVKQNFKFLWYDSSTYNFKIRIGIALYCYLFPVWLLLVNIYSSLIHITEIDKK